jgi:hypothetical protein
LYPTGVKLKNPAPSKGITPVPHPHSTMNFVIAIALLFYMLGMIFPSSAIRMTGLMLLFFYVSVIFMESHAEYHRRCLRYHAEE